MRPLGQNPSAAEVLAGIMDALIVPRDTPWDELPHVVALRCRPIRREDLLGLILGSLTYAVDAHGPIDHQHLHSATTRVTDALHAYLKAKSTGGDANS
ncbi:MAG: hypothetical protein Q8O14_07640 [bacterium]|nr:hypothetical protein [bacterium]